MSYARRTDKNQTIIIQALRQHGYTVEDMSRVGHGFPDLCVGGIDRRTGERRTWLVEIKTDKGDLTKFQVEWHGAWRGQLATVRTANEALAVVGILQ